MPGKDGSTLRQHLEQAERATGQCLVQESKIPESAEYLLNWFWRLHQGRGGNGFGFSPISSCEIEAWSRITGNILEPWEVEAIRMMDQTFLTEVGKREK